MKIDFLKDFDKSFSKLSPTQQDQVILKIEQVQKIVEKKAKNNSGIRIKKFAENLFEARVDIHLRLLFLVFKNQLVFSLIRNHDDVKRYIKTFNP